MLAEHLKRKQDFFGLSETHRGPVCSTTSTSTSKANTSTVPSYRRPPAMRDDLTGLWTTRTQDISYPRQLVPNTTRTRDKSYPRQWIPKTTRTKTLCNPCSNQLKPKTTRIQDQSYLKQLVFLRLVKNIKKLKVHIWFWYFCFIKCNSSNKFND